jgi:hypothetical protein
MIATVLFSITSSLVASTGWSTFHAAPWSMHAVCRVNLRNRHGLCRRLCLGFTVQSW